MRFSSCQAEIAESFCKTLTEFIGRRLGVSTVFVGDLEWQEREKLFDRGQIDVCWICGLPYVRKRSNGGPDIELLAAPVMQHERYAEKPVYYSDIVVHAESDFRSFADLRGATWAYNERSSHSGYNVVRYHLAANGAGGRYFSRVVESGSHQDSLQMVLDRDVDASAIDSTVLEMEIARNASITRKFRTIAVLGPSPAPPWVIHRSVPDKIRDALRFEFLAMDKDPEGRRILETASILRFGPICDADYDPIREMDRVAATLDW